MAKSKKTKTKAAPKAKSNAKAKVKSKSKKKSTSRKPSSAKSPRRRRNPLAEMTERDIKEALQRPSSFGYSGDLPLFKTWSLGPVVDHRDATILAKANWQALAKELERHPEWSEQWAITGATHWATGWVDHLSFQVLDDQGEPTNIARFLKGWFDGLTDYPVADDQLYSAMQYEAYTDRLEQDLDDLERRKLREDLPEDWRALILGKLDGIQWEYDESDVPYYDEATLESVAEELGFLDEELAENPDHRPVFLILQDRSTGEIGGGQLAILDYGANGITRARLWDDEGETEWTFRPGIGWQTDRSSSVYHTVGIVTPDHRRSINPTEVVLGPGLGAWLGYAIGNSAGVLTALVLGAGTLGTVLTAWTLASLGAAAGGYLAAPEDRRRRAAIGGGVGNAVFPLLGIGAAVGGWIGGKHADPPDVRAKRSQRKAKQATNDRSAARANPTHRKIKNRVLR
jgi:hypothetical protein